MHRSYGGARPRAITNNLNFGNPLKPEVYYQLRECVLGMAEACRVFRTPVTGGNVSLYNENPRGAIYPTPVVGMIGVLDDVECGAIVTRCLVKVSGIRADVAQPCVDVPGECGRRCGIFQHLFVQFSRFGSLATSNRDLGAVKCVVDERACAGALVETSRLLVHPLGLVPLAKRGVCSREIVGPSCGILEQPRRSRGRQHRGRPGEPGDEEDGLSARRDVLRILLAQRMEDRPRREQDGRHSQPPRAIRRERVRRARRVEERHVLSVAARTRGGDPQVTSCNLACSAAFPGARTRVRD